VAPWRSKEAPGSGGMRRSVWWGWTCRSSREIPPGHGPRLEIHPEGPSTLLRRVVHNLKSCRQFILLLTERKISNFMCSTPFILESGF
jgi:hypothetical protein